MTHPEVKPCEYCGTTLTEDGANATDGSHHFAAQCREYVYAVMLSYQKIARDQSVILSRISGTLCDAGDVQVEPYPEAVATLLRQRNNLFLYAAVTLGREDAERIRDAARCDA